MGVNYDMITNCYSTGSVFGEYGMGGLAGANYNTITNCYSISSVTAGIDSDYIGGFLGWNSEGNGNFLSCFWDSSINPALEGIGNLSDPNVIGETTENMQITSTFIDAGWEFVDSGVGVADPNGIWRMCVDGLDYPRLAWQYPAGDFTCPDGVGLYDYAILGSLWLRSESDAGWHEVYDLYADGIIDASDLGIIHDNWLTEPNFP